MKLIRNYLYLILINFEFPNNQIPFFDILNYNYYFFKPSSFFYLTINDDLFVDFNLGVFYFQDFLKIFFYV
jgi:hypothetical protein